MKIFTESSTQKDKFRSAAHKLLNHCFLVKKKEDTRLDYIFVVQNKVFFDEYFDLLGYRLDINEMYGVVSLQSVTGGSRLRLKKIESIILLLLRLLFIEKSKELRLNEEVVVLTDELQQKFAMLKIEGKQMLDKTVLRDTIRLFRRYHLLQPLDRDVTIHDARIKMYPTILFAVPNEAISAVSDRIEQSINTKLSQYANGGETDDEDALQD